MKIYAEFFEKTVASFLLVGILSFPIYSAYAAEEFSSATSTEAANSEADTQDGSVMDYGESIPVNGNSTTSDTSLTPPSSEQSDDIIEEVIDI